MSKRTLNNKSSISSKDYQLQNNNKSSISSKEYQLHNNNTNNNYNYHNDVGPDKNGRVKDYNSMDFGKKYKGENSYQHNPTLNTEIYYQYIYPYGTTTTNSLSENNPPYLYHYPNNNKSQSQKSTYYNKNYTHQNYKYNKNKENNTNSQRRTNSSVSNTSNINYLKSKLRYFNDPIDIQTWKQMNNNKPYISVQTSSSSSSYRNNNSNNNKYRRNSDLKGNLHAIEENNPQPNDEQYQREQDSIYKLISKNHNIKRKTNKPILNIAGLDSFPVYSFDEMVSNKEIKLTQSDSNEQELNLTKDIVHLDLQIKDNKQFFKQFLKGTNTTSFPTTNHPTKKPMRNLVQTKHSLQFNKSFQQNNNDSFELSFDGKAMDRSDIFRMVDSFSIAFDNDRDPNTTNPNVSINNGNNTNSKSFTLSKNILPDEITNTLVY
ncbi:hypothetical protein MOSE0_L10858 [Monosporozyma servazzii]